MSENEIKYLWGFMKVEVISRNQITEKGIYKVLEHVMFKNPINNSWIRYWMDQIIVKPISAEQDKYYPDKKQ